MRGVNKVILIGNLGRDPEIRYTTSGRAVANFSVATTDSYTTRDGERQETTEWHRIVAWGKLAEICGEYLNKGKMVYIEGSLQTRSWEDKDGNTRQTTEIVARSMEILSPAGARSEPQNRNNQNPEGDFEIDDNSFSTDDDIPF